MATFPKFEKSELLAKELSRVFGLSGQLVASIQLTVAADCSPMVRIERGISNQEIDELLLLCQTHHRDIG